MSRDRALQHTRTLLLERAGYTVSAAHSEQEALQLLLSEPRSTLALICHSVPESSRVELAKRMKAQHPTMPVLLLNYGDYESTSAPVDGTLQSMGSPEALLNMVNFLTSGASEIANEEL